MDAKFWKGKRVLITGATGLLGAWLTDTLCKAKAEVVALVRDDVPQSNFFTLGLDKNVITVRGALEDYFLVERSLNEYEIEICFHLAAQAIVETSNRSPLSTFESNIKGSWNVLEAARHSKLLKRLIVASSDKAYGERERLPYTEDMPLTGRQPYDVSKSCVDLLAQAYFHTYKLPLAIIRCGNLYGGGDFNWSRIIPGAIRSVLQNESPLIRSDGTPSRDYFYVKDAVESYLLVAEKLEQKGVLGEAFNFGTEKPTGVLDVVKQILKLMKAEKLEPKVLNQATNEIQHQYLSCQKARQRLGWSSRYSLEKGLAETIEWYRTYWRRI